ncbi:hypothetical protein BDR26DRAFT_105370 [Obelidium mucronatum]|nr:hypothetical protein BDR26DRAFT_105370 [Obelidium mucronatum]
MRLAADEFQVAKDKGVGAKYSVKDGDSFGAQKVSLARRNIDGSLLFTNAYSGILPEDFYRVSEIDDNLTPVYIHPNLELSKAQIPDLGAVSRFDGVKTSKHKHLGISAMLAVDFAAYDPFQSFAPQFDSSNALISVKETIQMYKPRRNINPSKINLKELPLGLGDIELNPSISEADLSAAREILAAESINVDEAAKNMDPVRDQILSQLTTSALYNLNVLQDHKIVKKTMGIKADQDKLALKIQHSLLHSVLKSKSKSLMKASVSSARHDVLEPVFKGMLHPGNKLK